MILRLGPLAFHIEICGHYEEYRRLYIHMFEKLSLKPNDVMISFDGKEFIDINFKWPIFKFDLIAYEDIFFKFKNPRFPKEVPKIFLENLYNIFHEIITQLFSKLSISAFQTTYVDTIRDMYIYSAVYETEANPFSKSPIKFRLNFFVHDSRLYFGASTMMDYPSGKVESSYADHIYLEMNFLTIGENQFERNLMIKFDSIFSKIFEWKANPFLSLNHEVKLKIMKLVGPKDFISLCRTCKSLASYSKDNSIWRYFYRRYFKSHDLTTNYHSAFKARIVRCCPRLHGRYPTNLYFNYQLPRLGQGGIQPPYVNPEFSGVIGGPRDIFPGAFVSNYSPNQTPGNNQIHRSLLTDIDPDGFSFNPTTDDPSLSSNPYSRMNLPSSGQLPQLTRFTHF